MSDLSLLQHLGQQSARLCEVTGTDPNVVSHLLADLLGPAGSTALSHGPAWPSGVADDHTPVEFSVAFNLHGGMTLRILGEALASPADAAANLTAADRFLDAQADRFGVAMSRYARVRDLFASPDPDAAFALWFSLMFAPGRMPDQVSSAAATGSRSSPLILTTAQQRGSSSIFLSTTPTSPMW
jgi:hypothetical protein